MTEASSSSRVSSRIRGIDVARGFALVAMAIYHFTWDLEFFGYLEPGLTGQGGWKLFARCIASSFLFLVGISLILAHARGVRWRPYFTRLAQVAGAAAIISLATYVAVPGGFIFFGILHQIALASLLGVLVLNWRANALVFLAVIVIAAPYFLRSDVFDPGWLWWIGLSANIPRSNDYVPLFPWFGAVLLGMAVARIALTTGVVDKLRGGSLPRPLQLLEKAGQQSLAFYLIHQPVLIGLVWLFSQLVPPPAQDPSANFTRACQTQCSEVRGAAFCEAYCGCMVEEIETMPGGLAAMDQMSPTNEQQSQVQAIAEQCTLDTDAGLLNETIE